MSTATGRSRRWRSAAAPAVRQPRALTPAELAWVALLPCAIAGLLAIVLLGPPLGQVLFPPDPDGLWPPGWWETRGHPEPVKHGRFVLAVIAPALLVTVVLAGMRREPKLRPQAIRAIALASQVLVLAFVVLAVLGQHGVVLAGRPMLPVFGVGTLLVAASLVVAALLLLRVRGAAERIARIARETPARRVAGLALALAVAAVWMLKAVTTDAIVEDIGRLNWTLNDAFAVLNGRTPLVDYHLIYGKLMPYPAALALYLFGTTALVYSIAMAALNLLTLLAVYATFRRIVRSSVLALALFAPFLALGDPERISPFAMPAMWPMRYGGAFLLAWLTARHVDRARPHQAWVLFFVGGLAAVNSLEFGVAALLATVAAVLCARPPASARAALRLAGEAAGGALAALVVVSLFTLVRAGALPDPALMTEWPRIFTNFGWFSLPMPRASLHLALYATFTAAVAAAAVRVARSAGDLLLTSMLAWSGVFGLFAAAYYVARPDDVKLVSMFSAWSFALALLTVVCVRELAARGWRRPALPHLLVLFGFALAICSVAGVPPPGEEVARLTAARPAPQYRAAAKQFVAQRVRPGETVAILLPEGYRIAYDLGLRNVAPYQIQNAIVTRAQLQTLIDTLEHERVDEVFVPLPESFIAGEGDTAQEQLNVLAAAGFPATSWDERFVELRRVGAD